MNHDDRITYSSWLFIIKLYHYVYMYLNTILNSHLNDFPISLNIHFKTHLSNEKQGVLKKSQVLKLISWYLSFTLSPLASGN